MYMPETQRTTEVNKTTTEPGGAQVVQREVSQATPGAVLFKRSVWFILGVINALIALRFIFLLLGANRDAGFVDFIYTVTSPLVAPFAGIFGEPTYGQFMFDWSSVLAVIIYSLIAWGITKLATLTRPREEV